MPKYNFFPQYSEEWERIRLGIPTASEFHKIITPGGKASAQWKTYAHRLIAERILKRQVDFAIAGSPWMERGKELEPEALADYEIMSGLDTKEVGFIIDDDGICGCSPDRLVGEDGLLELKVPSPQMMVEYLIYDNAKEDYKPQLQGQIYVSKRDFIDIFPYSPEFPRRIIRVYPEASYQHCLRELLNRFNDYIVDNIIKIAEQMQEIRKPDAIEELLGRTE